MTRKWNTFLLFAILLLLSALFAGYAAAEEAAVPGDPEGGASLSLDSGDMELAQLQLGSSRYSVDIPASYQNSELTIEDTQANQIAYYLSPLSGMDFDIYQFQKSDPELTLEEYTARTAETFVGKNVRVRKINGIDVGTYLSREFYDGIEYDVMTALIEDGDDYIEVVFWLDGENAGQEAEDILNTLSETPTYDLQLGTLPFVMSVPTGYRLREEEELEDPAKGRLWYYASDHSPLDFDVYQWEKEGYTLEKYAIEEARNYEAELVEYRTVNDIFLAYYYSYEEDQGEMYSVINYLFEDGHEFIKVSFWLDGDIAVKQTDRILSTLRRTDSPDPAETDASAAE